MKKVSVERIDPETQPGIEMYALMNRLIAEAHEELTQAQIALAWNRAWRLDADGRLTLGKCRKASDLDREFVGHDFVILLNRNFWESAEVTDAQRAALMDHELSHAMPLLDEDGEQVEDERGRRVWRLRKHEIEEFVGVVHRHGVYKADLEHFAQALARGAKLAGQVGMFADDAVTGRADGAAKGVHMKIVKTAVLIVALGVGAGCVWKTDQVVTVGQSVTGPTASPSPGTPCELSALQAGSAGDVRQVAQGAAVVIGVSLIGTQGVELPATCTSQHSVAWSGGEPCVLSAAGTAGTLAAPLTAPLGAVCAATARVGALSSTISLRVVAP